MGTSLGSLGTPRDPVDIHFEYFGVRIRVHPDATDLDVADLMSQFGHLDDEDPTQSAEVMQALAGFLVKQIHPEDRELFWETAKTYRQQIRDIMAVSKAITEAVAGFPTGQSSDSASGPRTTRQNSEAGSSSRRERRARAQREYQQRAAPHALTVLHGRPDLQTAILSQRDLEEDTG